MVVMASRRGQAAAGALSCVLVAACGKNEAASFAAAVPATRTPPSPAAPLPPAPATPTPAGPEPKAPVAQELPPEVLGVWYEDDPCPPERVLKRCGQRIEVLPDRIRLSYAWLASEKQLKSEHSECSIADVETRGSVSQMKCDRNAMKITLLPSGRGIAVSGNVSFAGIFAPNKP